MYELDIILTDTMLFCFGIAIGSFLNVLSDRLPAEQSILGRSHCDNCKHTLHWYDLFPLFSFLSLKGKCRYCKVKLSIFYPLSEFMTGIMFVLSWHFLPSGIATLNTFLLTGFNEATILKLLYLIITSSLIVIFLADVKYKIIPDSIQVVILLAAFILHILGSGFHFSLILSSLAAGFMVMLPLLLLFILTKGKGMGFGDVKLAFVLGVLFGVKLGLITLYVSFVIGALAGLILIFFGKKKMTSKIAFGPFIVLASFILLFFQSNILALIKSLWGV